MRCLVLPIVFAIIGGVVFADDNSEESKAIAKIKLPGGAVYARNGTGDNFALT